MISKFRLALPLVLLCHGCFYTSHTAKMGDPITREIPEQRYESVFDVRPEGGQYASIGDELFRISRYDIGREEFVRISAPTSFDFPSNATWDGTYTFNDGKSGPLIVYTTSKYYKGTIGVILDADEELATRAPLVQVDGAKEGRRWKLNGTGKFFSPSNILIERWGLRYGGLSDNNYIFELFNKNDANVVEIIQSIEITESGFLEGFTVRGVFIKGLEKDVQGVIKYSVRDILNTDV